MVDIMFLPRRKLLQREFKGGWVAPLGILGRYRGKAAASK